MDGERAKGEEKKKIRARKKPLWKGTIELCAGSLGAVHVSKMGLSNEQRQTAHRPTTISSQCCVVCLLQ